MKNNSDDYLDSFSDKPMNVGFVEKIFNKSDSKPSIGSVMTFSHQTGIGLGDLLLVSTVVTGLKVLGSGEETGYTLNDHTEVVAEKKRRYYTNAIAYNLGLYWIQIKSKKLNKDTLYATENALTLLSDTRVPSCDTVMLSINPYKFLAGERPGGEVFRVKTAQTFDPAVKERLQKIDSKLLKPVVAHKSLLAFTDMLPEDKMQQGCFALVTFADLAALSNYKTNIDIFYGDIVRLNEFDMQKSVSTFECRLDKEKYIL